MLKFALAMDGVEMRHLTPHSTQIAFLQCTSMHDGFKSQQRNVQTYLVIPGPKAPNNYDVFFFLMLQPFAESARLAAKGVARPPSARLCNCLSLNLARL